MIELYAVGLFALFSIFIVKYGRQLRHNEKPLTLSLVVAAYIAAAIGVAVFLIIYRT